MYSNCIGYFFFAAHCSNEAAAAAAKNAEDQCKNSFEDNSRTADDSINGNTLKPLDPDLHPDKVTLDSKDTMIANDEQQHAATNFITSGGK